MKYEIIKDWFQIGCRCIVPTTMAGRLLTKGRSNKYPEKVFFEGLKKEFEGEMPSVRLTSTDGDMLTAARNVDTLDKYNLLCNALYFKMLHFQWLSTFRVTNLCLVRD